MPLLASIDVGSNTVRLLAAEVEDSRIIKEVLNLREITRLGEGLVEGGRLKEAARARTIAVLKEYAAKLKVAGIKDVKVVATEALRRAADAAAFAADVKDAAGLTLEVISGEEEARLTLLGVKAGIGKLGFGGRKLLVDIGGGSTELVLTEGWDDFKALSLPLGAVSLHERFLISDPPADEEIVKLEGYCFLKLGGLDGFLGQQKPDLLVGTAGTITTLAAVDLAMDAAEYDPLRVTGHRISRDTVSRLLARFIGLPKENRRLIAGLEPGREDIIVSGTVLLAAIMDRAGADFIVACDFGLREGNLLDTLENKRD
jgi:exopolyphosphatase/guanosine-5'-triphosphate,3'-diphosphate pyrophosphatase